MSHGLTIALDAMGGDFGPEVVVPAALRALEADDDLRIILVGDEAVLRTVIARNKSSGNDRLRIHHASQTRLKTSKPNSSANKVAAEAEVWPGRM